MVLTTYTYVPNRKHLDRLLEIKKETGVAVARQLDYAIELLFSEYDWDRELFIENLKEYIARKDECGPQMPT